MNYHTWHLDEKYKRKIDKIERDWTSLTIFVDFEKRKHSDFHLISNLK